MSDTTDDAVAFSRDDAFEQDKEFASPELLSLINQVDRDVVAWMPERAGDKVIGKLIDISEAGQDSEFGEYPMLVIETPTGRLVAVHAFHTVLRREIGRKVNAKDPMVVGDLVAVAYRGELAASGGKNPAHMYRLTFTHPKDTYSK